VEILKQLHETVCREKAWTLAKQLDSPSLQCSRSSQEALYQAVSGPEIDYWSGTPTLFPWFGSKWFLAVSRNKVYLKEWRFHDIEGIEKYVMSALKANCITGVTKKVSNSGSIIELSA